MKNSDRRMTFDPIPIGIDVAVQPVPFSLRADRKRWGDGAMVVWPGGRDRRDGEQHQRQDAAVASAPSQGIGAQTSSAGSTGKANQEDRCHASAPGVRHKKYAHPDLVQQLEVWLLAGTGGTQLGVGTAAIAGAGFAATVVAGKALMQLDALVLTGVSGARFDNTGATGYLDQPTRNRPR